MTFRIGIISDRHGLLRPEAERRLAGVDHIIHGGDIGRPEIIDALRRIAPVTAIRGNMDIDDWLLHTLKPRSCDLREKRSTFCTI
jgi:uncharacterized protein